MNAAKAHTLTDKERAGLRTKIGRERLADAVTQAGWRFLAKGDSLDRDQQQHVVVVGVASWNSVELRALNYLTCKEPRASADIAIFDIDNCLTESDLDDYIPGVEPPIETPVVAEYRDGVLARSAEGPDGLSLLRDLH